MRPMTPKCSNVAHTTGVYDKCTNGLHGGAMEEKTTRAVPGHTVLGVLLLGMSGALLAVDLGLSGVVDAIDPSLPPSAGLEIESNPHIAL
jgi:hypothetical protein